MFKVNSNGKLHIGNLEIDFSILALSFYDEHEAEELFISISGYWYEFKRNEFGDVLKYNTSTGYWYTSTYDVFGNILTYEDRNKNWEKYTRDSTGSVLSYSDSSGEYYGYK